MKRSGQEHGAVPVEEVWQRREQGVTGGVVTVYVVGQLAQQAAHRRAGEGVEQWSPMLAVPAGGGKEK